MDMLFHLYAEKEVKNPALIVDTNHSNSNKRPLEQVRICRDVMGFREYSNDIKHLIKGFMIESYLEDGSQPIMGTVYGKSVTDPCLGWENTERLICEIAEKV